LAFCLIIYLNNMQDIRVLGKVTPTCEGVHDINKEYSRLSIVTNTDNTKSYISKKDVPINIAITDEEYWQLLIKSTIVNDDVKQEIIDFANTKVDERLYSFLTRMEQIENRLTDIETAIKNGTIGSGSGTTIELIDMNLIQPLSEE